MSFYAIVYFVLHPCNELDTGVALLILFLDNGNYYTSKADVFFDTFFKAEA